MTTTDQHAKTAQGLPTTSQKQKKSVVLERSYEASPEELWELWTTKEGFEAWWGPEGFAVQVHEIDPKVGGKISYTMMAVGKEQIAFMEQSGQAVSHGTTGVFSAVVPFSELTLRHLIDFIPGVAPYEHDMTVHFYAEGAMTRMVIHIDPHNSDEWTRMATMGMESQLTKLPGALVARRG